MINKKRAHAQFKAEPVKKPRLEEPLIEPSDFNRQSISSETDPLTMSKVILSRGGSQNKNEKNKKPITEKQQQGKKFKFYFYF
jgi:hypothetical protein